MHTHPPALLLLGLLIWLFLIPAKTNSEGDTRVVLSAREREDDEMWRRVNLAEAEHGKVADEKGTARLRRLKNL